MRQLHKLITLGDRWVPQKSKSKHVSLSVLRKSNSIDIIKASAVIKAPFAVVLDVLQNYDPKFWSKRNHAELADCRVVEQTGHHQVRTLSPPVNVVPTVRGPLPLLQLRSNSHPPSLCLPRNAKSPNLYLFDGRNGV